MLLAGLLTQPAGLVVGLEHVVSATSVVTSFIAAPAKDGAQERFGSRIWAYAVNICFLRRLRATEAAPVQAPACGACWPAWMRRRLRFDLGLTKRPTTSMNHFLPEFVNNVLRSCNRKDASRARADCSAVRWLLLLVDAYPNSL